MQQQQPYPRQPPTMQQAGARVHPPYNPMPPPRGPASNFGPPPRGTFAPQAPTMQQPTIPARHVMNGHPPQLSIPPPNFLLQTPPNPRTQQQQAASMPRGYSTPAAQQQQPSNGMPPPRMPSPKSTAAAMLPPRGLAPLNTAIPPPRGVGGLMAPRGGVSPMNAAPRPAHGGVSPMNAAPRPAPGFSMAPRGGVSPMNAAPRPAAGFNMAPRGPAPYSQQQSMMMPRGGGPPPSAQFQQQAPRPQFQQQVPRPQFQQQVPRPQFQQPPPQQQPPPPRQTPHPSLPRGGAPPGNLPSSFAAPHNAAAPPPPSNRPNLDFPPVPVAINSSHFDLPKDGQPFTCADIGNASYRYMRPTCRYIPTNSSRLDELKLPLAIMAQPFAEPQGSEERGVPLSEWNNESGPVRCTRCRAYINCFAKLNADYSKWECALCQHTNELPVVYRGFAQSGNCAELKLGSVEFQVNESFFSADQRKPRLDILILLDASQASLRSGLFSYTLHSISSKLRQQNQFPADSRLGICTYDETGVQFYHYTGQQFRVLICGDVDDGFSPLPSDAIMHSGASADALVQFVAARFQVDALQANTGSIGGAALASAVSCLKQGSGGRIVWLSSQLPIRGQGKLVERELPAILGNLDKEQLLYVAPAEETFYNTLATVCLHHNVCLDVVSCGPQFMDLATLVQISSTTGGSLERIPLFAASNAMHRQALDLHLGKVFSSARALGVNLKARVSTGLTVKRTVGHGFADEMSFKIACMSNEYCMGIELEHDGTKLNENQPVICQLAVLYTSPQGNRRLRVHNFALTAKERVHAHQFDHVSICNLWGKQLCLLLAEKNVAKTREVMLKRLAVCLANGEARSTLVTYCNSLLKTPALLVNKPLDQRHVREPFAFADARILSRFRLLDMSNDAFLTAMYPYVLDLTQPDVIPVRIPCGSECIKAEGIYLLFDGTKDLDVFVGSRANGETVEAYFGAAAIAANRAVVVHTLAGKLGSAASQNLARLCRQLVDGVSVIRINFASNPEFFTEAKPMFPKLMEDKIYTEQSLAGFMSYVNQMSASARGGGGN